MDVETNSSIIAMANATIKYCSLSFAMTGCHCGKSTKKIFEANQKPGVRAGLFLLVSINITSTVMLDALATPVMHFYRR